MRRKRRVNAAPDAQLYEELYQYHETLDLNPTSDTPIRSKDSRNAPRARENTPTIGLKYQYPGKRPSYPGDGSASTRMQSATGRPMLLAISLVPPNCVLEGTSEKAHVRVRENILEDDAMIIAKFCGRARGESKHELLYGILLLRGGG